MNLAEGRNSELIVTTGDGGGAIVAGTGGINANGAGRRRLGTRTSSPWRGACLVARRER